MARLAAARHVCVLTGAGVSAESGVPTFRDARQGLWARYGPERLATPSAFRANPGLVWDWYRWRRGLVAGAEPNPGHRALAAFEHRVPVFTLVTQNVDGLHQRAGSSHVIEFHGNLFVDRCLDQRADQCLDECVDRDVAGIVTDDGEGSGDLPRCPACGGVTRPGVVWFGEAIPEAALEAACRAAADCDLFLSIGTSSLVYPAAGLVDVAREAGAVTVEINPQPTGGTAAFDFVIAGPSGVVLPKLLESVYGPDDRPGPQQTENM